MFNNQRQISRGMSYKRLPKVLAFYELPDTMDEYLCDVNRKLKVKCKYCPKSIVGSVRVTSNFITHLKKTHQRINAEFEMEKKSSLEVFTKSLRNGESEVVKSSIDDNKPESVEILPDEGLEPSRKERLDAFLVKFIASSSLNSSLVLSNEFVSFVHELCPSYEVPSLNDLTGSLLPEFAAKTSESIRRLLEESDSVSLSVETWTEPLLNGFIGRFI